MNTLVVLDSNERYNVLMHVVFGVLSGILPIIGAYPYIRDILRGKTKPHRMAEFIWAVLGSIAFSAQVAKGATWSTIMPAIGVLETTVGFFLALKYGMGGATSALWRWLPWDLSYHLIQDAERGLTAHARGCRRFLLILYQT